MGSKSSTAAANSGATLPPTGTESDTRSRALSTSAGASDSGLGLLRSASQGAGGGASNTSGPPNSSSLARERVGDRGRTRSLSSVPGVSNGATALSIPTLLSRATGSGTHSMGGGGNNSSETEGSSPEEFGMEGPLTALGLGRVFATHSLPAHLWSFNASSATASEDEEQESFIDLTEEDEAEESGSDQTVGRKSLNNHSVAVVLENGKKNGVRPVGEVNETREVCVIESPLNAREMHNGFLKIPIIIDDDENKAEDESCLLIETPGTASNSPIVIEDSPSPPVLESSSSRNRPPGASSFRNNRQRRSKRSWSLLAGGGKEDRSETQNCSIDAGDKNRRDDDEPSGSVCPVCFESFKAIKKKGESLSSTVCGHVFCTSCLESSFRIGRHQCPTCRKRLKRSQYHPLYL